MKKLFKRRKSIFIFRNNRYEFRSGLMANKSMTELYDIHGDDLLNLLENIKNVSKLKKEDIKIIDIIMSKLK